VERKPRADPDVDQKAEVDDGVAKEYATSGSVAAINTSGSSTPAIPQAAAGIQAETAHGAKFGGCGNSRAKAPRTVRPMASGLAVFFCIDFSLSSIIHSQPRAGLVRFP